MLKAAYSLKKDISYQNLEKTYFYNLFNKLEPIEGVKANIKISNKNIGMKELTYLTPQGKLMDEDEELRINEFLDDKMNEIIEEKSENPEDANSGKESDSNDIQASERN